MDEKLKKLEQEVEKLKEELRIIRSRLDQHLVRTDAVSRYGFDISSAICR